MLLKKNIIYSLFFVILLCTEFYYIQIGDGHGYARIYHFVAVIVVFLLIGFIKSLFKSKIFLSLLVFVFINLCAVTLSDEPSAALASLSSLCANIAVAMATALILRSGKIDLASFKRIVLIVSVISVLWGLLQIVAFRIAGLDLSLSSEQRTQILIGFGPGFRTEANTFGKYMVLPFFLFLPDLINHRDKSIILVYLVILVGILMNFTRTSIYGILITLTLLFFWYFLRGKSLFFIRKTMIIAGVTVIFINLLLAGFLTWSEYGSYKFENLFSEEEIFEGSSSAYRIESMQIVIEGALSDPKKLLIGNGWGQTYIYFRGKLQQAGGGDIITVLGYSGLIGIVAYLIYMWFSFIAAKKVARNNQDINQAQFAEGVMFAFFGIFITSQMAGYFITPEYWMLIGVCIYLNIGNRPKSHLYDYNEYV